VFAVNGRIEGAEIYQSHQLFGRMWPNLLRAFATQAIAASDATAEILPPISAVKASLAAARGGEPRVGASGGALVVRESNGAIYTEARAVDGSVVHRSYVPKLIGAATTPDALVASILQAGAVDGQPLADLGKEKVVVLSSAAPGEWSAAIAPSLAAARDADMQAERMAADTGHALQQAQAEWRHRERERADTLWAVLLASGALAFLILCLRRHAAATGRALRRWAAALRPMPTATLRPALLRPALLRPALARARR
jgi:hypothetical protein